MNYLRGQVPEGKEPLLLNLDETAVAFFHGDQKGNLAVRRRRRCGDAAGPVQRVTRRQLRACLTHVAIIAECDEVQQVWPQWVLGNESVMLKRDVTAVQPGLPENVRLVRGKSSWTNVLVMCKLLHAVGVALHPWMDTRQPILLMDMARQHLDVKVARAAHAAGIWIMFVPAGLTWLMQPCDTHVFRAQKHDLRRRYLEARLASADGNVVAAEWLRMVSATIVRVLQGRPWRRAFAEDGYGALQTGVSKYILDTASPALPLPAPAGEPSAAELAVIFPKRCKVWREAYLRPVRAVQASSALPGPAALPALAAAEAPERATGVWAGRLRRRVPAPAASGQALPPEDPPAHPPPLPSPLPRSAPGAWPRPAAPAAASASEATPGTPAAPAPPHPTPVRRGPLTRSQSRAGLT
jgi:hypothetical protein